MPPPEDPLIFDLSLSIGRPLCRLCNWPNAPNTPCPTEELFFPGLLMDLFHFLRPLCAQSCATSSRDSLHCLWRAPHIASPPTSDNNEQARRQFLPILLLLLVSLCLCLCLSLSLLLCPLHLGLSAAPQRRSQSQAHSARPHTWSTIAQLARLARACHLQPGGKLARGTSGSSPARHLCLLVSRPLSCPSAAATLPDT